RGSRRQRSSNQRLPRRKTTATFRNPFGEPAEVKIEINRLPIPISPSRFSLVSDTLVINESYLSLQGESTFAGLPCIFIRLTACNLRCSYCDTAYAFTEGKKQSLEDIRAEVKRLAVPFRREIAVEDDACRAVVGRRLVRRLTSTP